MVARRRTARARRTGTCTLRRRGLPRAPGPRDGRWFSMATTTACATDRRLPHDATTPTGAGSSMAFAERQTLSMTMLDYVELRCRSAFSFLDGASLPEDLVAAAARGGSRHAGARRSRRRSTARRASSRRRARPACVRSSAPRSRWPDGAAPLLLLVEDRRGYQNLCRLITAAMDRGTRKADPPTRDAALCSPSTRRGLIALGGRGAARRSAGARRRVRARQRLPRGAAPPATPPRRTATRAALAQAAALGIGVVATNDVRYATPRAAAACTTC